VVLVEQEKGEMVIKVISMVQRKVRMVGGEIWGWMLEAIMDSKARKDGRQGNMRQGEETERWNTPISHGQTKG